VPLPPGPSAGGLQPPPVTPPDVPSMSSYPSATGQAPAGDGRSTAVQKLVFEIEQALDLLSQMAPGASDLAEEAKITVRSALKAGLGMSPPVGRNSTFTGPMEGEGASGGLR
jgi:hypothetical protein